MSIQKIISTTAIAGVIVAALGTSIHAQNSEGWTVIDSSGDNIGDLYHMGMDDGDDIYEIEAMQARFYIESTDAPVREGEYIVYDQSFPQCNEAVRDHFGQEMLTWGNVELHENPGGEGFFLHVSYCDGPVEEVLEAVY